MNEGRTLELFFINGKPDGMLTAEVFNWTGHFLVAPRTQLREALGRKEAKHTGVYILLGNKDGEPFAYVGEGEDISERIRNHDKDKEWWEKAILVTSSANNLNKAHIKYLEARLISEARAAKKIKLENGTTPEPRGLTEAARTNMEVFLDYALMVLPALNVDYFANSVRSAAGRDTLQSDVPLFELQSKKHNIRAKARLANNEFIVEKGSHARCKWEGSLDWDVGYQKLHGALIENKILESEGIGAGERRIFDVDYAFSSPSAAAAVVLGRPAGSREWKVRGTNVDYREWEKEQIK